MDLLGTRIVAYIPLFQYQQVIPVLKGNIFSEKWAYLVYDFDKNTEPYAPVVRWQKRLTNPLRIQLVEEVDEQGFKNTTGGLHG